MVETGLRTDEWLLSDPRPEDVAALLETLQALPEPAEPLGPPTWPEVASLAVGTPGPGAWRVGSAAPPLWTPAPRSTRADVVDLAIIEECETLRLFDVTGRIELARQRRWVDASVRPGPTSVRLLGGPDRASSALRLARHLAHARASAASASAPDSSDWVWHPRAFAALWHHFALRGLAPLDDLAAPRMVIDPRRAAPLWGGERVEVEAGTLRGAGPLVLELLDTGSAPDPESARLELLLRTPSGAAVVSALVHHRHLRAALAEPERRGRRRHGLHLGGFDYHAPAVLIFTEGA